MGVRRALHEIQITFLAPICNANMARPTAKGCRALCHISRVVHSCTEHEYVTTVLTPNESWQEDAKLGWFETKMKRKSSA
jgi:hypothetical protein